MYLAIAELAQAAPAPSGGGGFFQQLVSKAEAALPGAIPGLVAAGEKAVGIQQPAPTPTPAPAKGPAVLPVGTDTTPGWVTPVAIGAAVLVAGGIAWFLLRKKA